MDIDLRSDTVTQPTAAMRQAMMAAPLGDDVLGDEPTVHALEAKVAALLGKEAALFTPSGTMANQLAIRCHTEPGDEIVAHAESHIIHYETGSPAALSGCMIRSLEGARGQFDADAVHAAIRGHDIHSPARGSWSSRTRRTAPAEPCGRSKQRRPRPLPHAPQASPCTSTARGSSMHRSQRDTALPRSPRSPTP